MQRAKHQRLEELGRSSVERLSESDGGLAWRAPLEAQEKSGEGSREGKGENAKVMRDEKKL